jgi:hypothetical protein
MHVHFTPPSLPPSLPAVLLKTLGVEGSFSVLPSMMFITFGVPISRNTETHILRVGGGLDVYKLRRVNHLGKERLEGGREKGRFSMHACRHFFSRSVLCLLTSQRNREMDRHTHSSFPPFLRLFLPSFPSHSEPDPRTPCPGPAPRHQQARQPHR